MGKKGIITQSNYIPWKGYFDAINTADVFVVYDEMQYTKRDWRNRNKIKTPHGPKWLSVPVQVKGKYHQKINETKVSDPNWGKSHWGSITQAYSKAQYFNEFQEPFKQFYNSQTPELLTEINIGLIQIVNDILGIKIEILRSKDFNLADGKTERLVNLCKDTGITEYYSGPAAKNYMEENTFENAGIEVHYFDYSGYPEYPQLYGEFTHEVSILDLIFNVGNDAINYMKSFNHG